jgi:hypothetical protein
VTYQMAWDAAMFQAAVGELAGQCGLKSREQLVLLNKGLFVFRTETLQQLQSAIAELFFTSTASVVERHAATIESVSGVTRAQLNAYHAIDARSDSAAGTKLEPPTDITRSFKTILAHVVVVLLERLEIDIERESLINVFVVRAQLHALTDLIDLSGRRPRIPWAVTDAVRKTVVLQIGKGGRFFVGGFAGTDLGPQAIYREFGERLAIPPARIEFVYRASQGAFRDVRWGRDRRRRPGFRLAFYSILVLLLERFGYVFPRVADTGEQLHVRVR